MVSRNVAIRKDVYDALAKEKRPRESFTQLFMRLLRQRGPLDDLAGTWGKAPAMSETRLIHHWRSLGTFHRGRRR